MSKLYIYDQTSLLDREQASGRFSAGENVHSLPVDSVEDLQGRLDYLVSSGKTFDRVLFQTHGADRPGNFAIGNEWINAARMLKDFGSKREYFKLFPDYTRVYFDGCNVAGGMRGHAS